MNSRMFATTLFVALAMTVQVAAHAGEIHFTPLNDPNQGPLGTAGNAVNDLGVAAGNYVDANGALYGFVSTAPYSDRSFTTVTVEVAGSPFVNIWGINLEGAVAGWSQDASGVFHGLVSRPPYTNVTTFDAPDACSSDSNPACSGNGTFGFGINLQGVIAGYYVDAQGIAHGFVTHPPYTPRSFTTLDPPGACSSGPACSGLGTVITYLALNDLGAVTGTFYDAHAVPHGFVSYPPYTHFATFDPPGAEATSPQSINFFGVITGTYFDAEGVGHGFVSHPPYTNTTFTSFDAAGSIEMVPNSINAEGVVSGSFYDASDVAHGFLSHPPYSTVTTFDAPDACSSDVPACAFNGTFPYGINEEGVFTGFSADASGNRHGFVARQ